VARRPAKYIDGFADKTSTPAKDELKELIISAKKDESEFVRLQAENVERWTIMLAAGELTPLEKAATKSWRAHAFQTVLLCYKDVFCNHYKTCSLTGLTPAGFKKQAAKLDVLTKLETIKLELAAKVRAQRLANGIQKYIIDGLCKLL
jgi:hypothetical protein